ncbi:protein TALPID3 [Callorhinchus milii]|uniref:protein TALPID3 n=1 Tax=Callorhinchus milii TaxID=7868 RepID=UPI001C3F5613|nr:protein TALPID3 [Callorhinchus milii]
MKKGCDVKDIKFNKDGKDKAQTKLTRITKKSLSTARPLQKPLTEPYGKRNPRSKPATQQREQKSKVIADPDAISSAEPVLQGEDYLRRVYGKALYQGHRSTSKKGPYLRFNSPAPKAKPQRPKMVENTKGVKVKSARTQTNPFPVKTVVSSPTIQRPFSAPLLPSNQYLFSPSNEMASSSAISGPVEGHLLPMAIPLGEPRIDGGVLQPARLLISGAQPVTLTTSIPPKPQLRVRKPNAAVVHVKSEKKSLPKLCVQVLPNVDIDSLPSDSPSASHRSSSPEQKQLSTQPAQSLIKLPEVIHGAEGEEEPGFPGISFIAVTDVVEDQDNEDALPEPSEPGIELEGFAGSVSLSYHGTPFPPSAPAPQPVVDIVDRMIQRKESIENQLVEWVEQELMSQIISEMYPFQPAPVPHVSNRDESEESLDSASDIVEAAGGSGLQLFVDAGVPVDSGLVRQFVNEALAEIVAIMLGQRESQSTDPVQEGAIGQTPSPEVLVPTPVPTPRHTPSPPAKGSPTIQTPELTPQGSVAVSEEREPESETELKSLAELSPVESPAKVSPVGTPAVTPVPTPSRVSTPSLVTTKDACQVPSPQLPNPWGDAELPLEEENPNSRPETSLQPRAVCMSVAKDEEPESLILPPCPVVAVPEKSPSTPPQARTTPPSTEESSSTISTETADRNISEGEVLISYGQIAAAKAFLEGGLPLPHLNESLSSTLRDAQEMDEDSPSEGQVIRAPHRGGEMYSFGTLLANMNRGPFAPQEIYHPENSDDENSAGQISEGQMPQLTAATERILTGHSQYMNPFAVNRHGTSIQRRRRLTSPGQLGSQTGRSERLSEASYGPMSLAELEAQTVLAPRTRQVIVAPQKTGVRGQGDEIAGTEQRPAITHLLLVEPATLSHLQPSTQGDMDQMRVEPNIYLGSQFPGTEAETNLQSNLQASPLKMSVTLPSMNEEEQCDSISTIDGDDTSGADIF